MLQQNVSSVNQILTDDNQKSCYFVYNNKFYKFNLQVFLNSSEYFFKERKTINVGDTIQLLQFESNLEFSDELIRNFISAVERNDQIEIKADNVYQLDQLSDFYGILNLKKRTNDFISENEEQLILQNYIYDQSNNKTNYKAEDIISNNLMNYIDDDKLATLKIDVLDRILTEYRRKNPVKHQNEATKDDIIKETKIKNFFLKCLQRKEPVISDLFNFIDYERFSEECLEIIQKDFSEIFRFSILKEKILQYLITHNFGNRDNKGAQPILQNEENKDDENKDEENKNEENEDEENKDEENKDEENKNEENEDEENKDEENKDEENKDEKEDEEILLELKELKDKIEKIEKLSDNVLKYPNVKSVPTRFFSFVENLASIAIPDSVVKICRGAFRECRSLTDVLFNETSKLETIEEYAFFGCKLLNNIQIPKTVTFIGIAAFMYCDKINVTLPPNLKTIEERIFYACGSLKSAIIPSHIKTIEYDAFHGCGAIENFKLPESLITIKRNGFAGLAIQSITFPASLKSIMINAFYKCEKLEEVIFTSDLYLIDSEAFNECSKLQSVKFLSTIKTIKTNAFCKCEKLKYIQFNSSPENIEAYAFNGK
ncbi:hypothetical protein M9Y10_030641 [Tritrichomonas musculus]|uniref:Uncharacterized protein n=1 Tax=Tritrichomonas musculus TaxID=1915356 RepID=A0ABR2H3G0_9EUKA